MQKIITLIVMILLSIPVFSQEKLEEVKIVKKQKGIQKSFTVTGNTTLITSKELLKAACCNLAESFETNPSIDVSFSDALTGTKQIKMLGLTSPYLMITEENIPSVRGASQAYGLSFTPGTWVESIQITKGAGSVVNGYESISGQINTELLKPINDIPFFLNVYGSTDSRFELNTHFNKKISDKWSSSLFLHGNTRVAKNDMNNDGFLDNPLAKQINILNRYQYYDAEKGWVSFINFRYMNDKKQTGELDFDPDKDRGTTNYWGSEINTERLDVSTKVGYVFPEMPYQSIGFQNAFNSHNQHSYFGLNQYNIKQSSYYSNLIFNSIINNTMNKFAAGLNFTYDKYQEFVNVNDYGRTDNSVGAFFEYTYDNEDDFSIILGGRIDNHNRLGTFITPRLHLRYNPWEKGVLRFSAGRGKRSANIFAENQQLFASSRTFDVLDNDGKIYGLNPEIAWNYGLSFAQKFLLFGKNADIGFDLYRTDFQNQVIVDVLQSPQQVLFYNLNGKSVANSGQLEFNYEILNHFNLRSAYKFYDVRTDYISGNYQKPLQAKHRFFGNLEYETHIGEKGKQWKFDYTFNWIGKQQLPNTASNPIKDRLPEFSPSYSLMNAQITRTFSSIFEMYVGGENIGNYTQEKAILGSDNPFGSTFDTSIAYAPVFGQMYYAGFRFKIK
ncbi:TonB-dependent receptor plug domain-containing protein [Flavobacterium gawalongense]|uniref:TonB-dependent receptor n=1 Tax=Flavobacterium gawalongense TaxID=2594432 RepID=A0A553BJ50_9FLAO|nr:TonB-dependent receptor plug domain-containing protein [Flavobacterium gawalongense]TRX08275.1 TonB-dependent receptor [Flavobacterium gawalongense]TRX09045.1 TonB-dependent receptor [Flavobacterium gawalongense]TRX25263.1 TonB-dependent receptor [Flavobacterium gawalongense]